MNDTPNQPSFIAGYLNSEALAEPKVPRTMEKTKASFNSKSQPKVDIQEGPHNLQLRLTIDTDLRDKINETINLWQNDGSELGFTYPNYPAFCRAALAYYFQTSQKLTEKDGVGPKKSVILRLNHPLYDQTTSSLPLPIRSKIYDRILRTFLKKLASGPQ